MRNAYHKTWNMAKTLKYLEEEKFTLQDLEYAEKPEKGRK